MLFVVLGWPVFLEVNIPSFQGRSISSTVRAAQVAQSEVSTVEKVYIEHVYTLVFNNCTVIMKPNEKKAPRTKEIVLVLAVYSFIYSMKKLWWTTCTFLKVTQLLIGSRWSTMLAQDMKIRNQKALHMQFELACVLGYAYSTDIWRVSVQNAFSANFKREKKRDSNKYLLQ